MKKHNKEMAKAMAMEVVSFFSEDPDRYRCRKFGICRYYPQHENQMGCAIGIYMTNENAKIADQIPDSSIIIALKTNPELFPTWFQELDPMFLHKMQQLHDTNSYWNSQGLTETGKAYYQQILKEYT